MSINIAVAGKGGTGKTSIVCLVIRYLMKNTSGPILAIDADPNANLGESLALDVKKTIGSIIASFNEEKIHIPSGMTKEAYLEFRINDAMVESKGLDLLTMGRGEAAGCYCYPNTLLRKFMDNMTDSRTGSYAYSVMDNEAGMEHLSRRTTQNIDELFLISDHCMKGVRTLARLREMVTELKLDIKRQSVIINFVGNGIDPNVRDELARLNIEPSAVIPLDEEVREYDIKVKSLLELPDTSGAVKAVDGLLKRLLEKSKFMQKGVKNDSTDY